jgi:Carboxypeptidase regulatory-like domain
VVAQDTAGNVSVSPSGGAVAANVNTVTTPPTVPSTYTVLTPFPATVTVGAGGTYPSLTNTGGLFEAMNTAAFTGNTVVNIITDLTGETGTVGLTSSLGGFAVLIKPSGGPRTISGVAPIAVIRINGADNVRIDGSTAASVVGGTPALRELTVQNLSTSTSSGVIHIGSATESSNGNTVKNVIAVGNDPLQTVAGISTGGATPTSTAAFANNNTRIENCSIQKVQQGIFTRGVSQTTLNTGTVISENDLSATGVNRVRTFGISVGNEDGILISQNSIGGMDTTGTGTDTFGIAAGITGINDSLATTTIGVTNAVIARNKVNGVSQDATFSAAGIAVAGIAGTNTIANNMVTGVISDGDGGDSAFGIFVTGVTGTTTRLYYNSVAMTGDRSALLTPSTVMNPSFGLAITGTDPIVELKNNIFYTSQIAATGGADATSYAIGTNAVTFANLDSNNNAFFSTGANDGGFRSGSLDRAVDATTEVDYATLALWQTAVADDASSVEGDPLFVNPLSNLHTLYSTLLLRDKGTPVSVLDDFDGDIRSLVGFAGGIPDIGADEALVLAPTASTASVRGRLLTPTGRGLMNAYVDLTNTNTGEVKRVRSTSLGYFNFQDLPVGNFYVISVQSKRYQFNTQSFTLEENLDGLVLTANDGQSK